MNPTSTLSNCFEISLENIRLRGNHGVMPQENIVGNDFEVTVRIIIPTRAGIHEDLLADTVSYADLYDVVKSEFDTPSRLLEHVCVRIEEKVRTKWPFIQSGEIKIVKLSPPISGLVGSASVRKIF